ncbi:MAG: glycosyltransferase family 4 protein [Pirellulaceae bacterium]
MADWLKEFRSKRGASVDIAHLTRTPPFAAGSFTRIVANVMQRMTAYRQLAISNWDRPLPENPGEAVIVVSRRNLALWRKLALKLPTRLRSRLFHGIGGRGCLAYIWQALEALRVVRPKIVVCYDEPWMGRIVRRGIDWPCRVIFYQHGLSYFLSTEEAAAMYSLNAFDSIWTLTTASYRFDRARMPYYEPTVRVVPNPIDTEMFHVASDELRGRVRASWNLPSDRPVVLFLSVLRAKKGAHLLVQAWPEVLRQVPHAFLWIVGGGEPGYERYLRQMVQALGVQDSVRLQGRVDWQQTPSCYQAADVYAFPTTFVEGMPLALGESLACGLPCVASDHLVSREAYGDGGVEFVPDPNLEGAFAGPLVELLSDAARRRSLGEKGRDYLVRRYSYATILPLMQQAYSRELSYVQGLA